MLVVGPAELLRLSRTQTMTRDVEQRGLFFHLYAPMCASTPRQPRPRCSVPHSIAQGYAVCLKLKRLIQAAPSCHRRTANKAQAQAEPPLRSANLRVSLQLG